MTTLVPRAPYGQDELNRLYPKNLELQLVQILLRHGERSPVSARFQNAGLKAYWPYCNAANRFSSAVMTNTDWSTWDHLQWRRRLETFGNGDSPVSATGPRGEVDHICNLGELTDKGRETTLALGQRLRHLYVKQLGFMPEIIRDAKTIYLRATPIPRALESVQQSFWGMYPATARTATFPPPTIITRTLQEETLFPNESSCRRFSQLSRAFAQRTADRWNDAEDMEYLNSLISRWMPDKRVAVDSHPRLSGIMDTVNSTLAHGPETRLPAPFYDSKGRRIIETIGVEEWFSGFKESEEYRKVGIGSLVGDITARMVDSSSIIDNKHAVGKESNEETTIKFAMSGCHDTTLAAILSSLGCFNKPEWPPYTSHIAFELFKEAESKKPSISGDKHDEAPIQEDPDRQNESPLKALFGSSTALLPARQSSTFDNARFALVMESIHGYMLMRYLTTGKITPPIEETSRKKTSNLTPLERAKLARHYVRIRYNDEPVIVPGCQLPGKHLKNDETFCTLEAFKAIVDKFTPENWKEACSSDLDAPTMPLQSEPAGF